MILVRHTYSRPAHSARMPGGERRGLEGRARMLKAITIATSEIPRLIAYTVCAEWVIAIRTPPRAGPPIEAICWMLEFKATALTSSGAGTICGCRESRAG